MKIEKKSAILFVVFTMVAGCQDLEQAQDIEAVEVDEELSIERDVQSLTAGSLDGADAYASPAPRFEYPVDGQILDYDGHYLFKVSRVPGASGYLWGFFQNGTMIWENLRDQGKLSSNYYSILSNSEAHRRFRPVDTEVWVRALVDGRWSNAGIITISFR